ncbi:MAG: hypothetical protein AAFQ94_02400 [Bacteroidota bacterium]
MSKNKPKLFSRLKKYILEFLMLFLAVFLGFFADNYREGLLEKSKERKYITSLIKDVEADKRDLIKVIKNNTFRKSYLDSLSLYCFAFDREGIATKKLYSFYPIVLQRPDFFIPNDLTMIQLKNAGGMRLINNQSVVEEILEYDLQKALIRNQQEYYENYQNKAISSGLKIFNYKKTREVVNLRKSNDTGRLRKMSYTFLENGDELIPQFGNEVAMYRGVVDYYNMLLTASKDQADSLIIHLKSAYEIK